MSETAVCKWCYSEIKKWNFMWILKTSGTSFCNLSEVSHEHEPAEPSPAVPPAPTVPIPEDLREMYEYQSYGSMNGRMLIERLSCAEATIAELELKYRRLMWRTHGHTGIYGDDGEMQCDECNKYGCWDYKNGQLSAVEKAYNSAIMERAARASGKGL